MVIPASADRKIHNAISRRSETSTRIVVRRAPLLGLLAEINRLTVVFEDTAAHETLCDLQKRVEYIIDNEIVKEPK